MHLNGATIKVVVGRSELDCLATVERELAIFQWAIHLKLDLGFCAFDGAEVARMLFCDWLQAGPRGIFVVDANVLDRWQVDHPHFVVRRSERAGVDIVFDVLRQAGEDELVGGSVRRSRHELHVDGLPSRGARVTCEDLRLLGLHSFDVRGNKLIAVAPDRDVARRNREIVQRRRVLLPARPKQ